MENTGRIERSVGKSIRRILYGQEFDHFAEEQLQEISRIDYAHLIMLSECGIVPRDRAAQLLGAIERLRAENFASLRNRPMLRGLFLLYEDYLIETEGEEIGGMLQLARSRNDLNATLLKLQLRRPYLRLLREALRLHAVLLKRAEKYAAVVMPVYTHGQAAMPSTYGHYLCGAATALLRDCEGLFSAGAGMQTCPLGAGAVAGTSFAILIARTAELLGFESGPFNSIDAVASRDLALKLLAACSIYAVTMSRLATDLMQWTTAEFDFLHLPDELVGSSSAMPQKRNPFLLEHVQGRSAALLGAFVHSWGSMHATPFTNSIAVGTEAVKPIFSALEGLIDTIVLLRSVVAAAKPNSEAMLRRAVDGYTVATAFADRLVAEGHAAFRTAHKLVGSAVRRTLERRPDEFAAVTTAYLSEIGISATFHDVTPESVAHSLEFGGGAGPCSLDRSLRDLRNKWASHHEQIRCQKRTWRDAALRLDSALNAALSVSLASDSP
jgi:argininosuccinate lyase